MGDGVNKALISWREYKAFAFLFATFWLQSGIGWENNMSKYTSFSSAEPNAELNLVEDVSPDEVNAKMDDLSLIDVRGAEEYVGELGHIPSSRLIPLDCLMDHIEQIPKDKTIVFICRSGRRSANAAAIAKDHGFESAYSMKGGMVLWNEMGLEIEK